MIASLIVFYDTTPVAKKPILIVRFEAFSFFFGKIVYYKKLSNVWKNGSKSVF